MVFDMQWGDSKCIGQMMLCMGLPGRRNRGRPHRTFMDVLKEEMPTVGVTEQDARYRVRRRQMICFRSPLHV